MRSAVPHCCGGPRAVCAQSTFLKKHRCSVFGRASVQSYVVSRPQVVDRPGSSEDMTIQLVAHLGVGPRITASSYSVGISRGRIVLMAWSGRYRGSQKRLASRPGHPSTIRILVHLTDGRPRACDWQVRINIRTQTSSTPVASGSTSPIIRHCGLTNSEINHGPSMCTNPHFVNMS
jgi:hypothetical protein